MDLFLVLPIVLIVLVALWALVVKMLGAKDRRDDEDDLPPTGAVAVNDTPCRCMECYDCLRVGALVAAV